MTTIPEFKARLISILDYLDSGILPNGSHIVFQGLADGLVLWENLHNRTHPIGVTYEEVYDFLNCLEISPCWVWMVIHCFNCFDIWLCQAICFIFCYYAFR